MQRIEGGSATALPGIVIRARVLAWVALAGVLLVAQASPARAGSALQSDIGAELHRLSMTALVAAGADQPPLDLRALGVEMSELHAFYTSREFTPVWLGDGRANHGARAALDVLRRAPEEGLVASDYAVARITSLMDETTSAELAELEMLLSAAVVRYARDLGNGRLAPQTLHPRHYAYPRDVDAKTLLQGVTEAGDPSDFIRAHAPDNVIYAGLRRALRTYREIEAAGGWPVISPGPKLERGDRGPRVALLRQRLRMTGDAGAPNGVPDAFDGDLEEAVKKFQRRHGLAVDGVVGPKTHAALVVPVQVRIRQLIVNIERARWMPHDLGDRHILVNAAGFEAWVVEGARPTLRMKAIVGKEYQQTPAFSDEMTYLVLNPYWNVPPGITRRETLPAVVRDLNYLLENDMEVLDGWGPNSKVVDPSTIDWRAVQSGRSPYRFRQRPGATNALGRVKFMFPNEHNVYMHDTPARQLFDRTVRTFSHGCIRISEPLELAAHLLGEQLGWSRSRIEQLIQSGEHKVVSLGRAIPVHVSYFTAWAEGGEVNFRDDVYGRDTRILEALFAAPAGTPSA